MATVGVKGLINMTDRGGGNVHGRRGDTRAAGLRGLDCWQSTRSSAKHCVQCPTTTRQRIANKHDQIHWAAV